MKGMKRLLLLVLLLTAVTGAWADDHLTSSADVGKVVCTDHTVYATVADATAAGKTPVAMIAYVNEELGTPQYGKALAISLEDAPIADIEKGCKQDEALALAEAYNTSHPVAWGTWRLPSVQDWEHMFIGCGSISAYVSSLPNSALLTNDYPFSSGNIRQMMIDAGGDAFYDNSVGYGYWSSTELSTMKGTWWTYYFTFPSNSDNFECGFTPSVAGHVRPCVEILTGNPHNLTLQEGTEDAEHWTISNPYLSGRIAGLKYSGNRVVKSVKLLNSGNTASTPYETLLCRPSWNVSMPDYDDVVVVEYDDSYNVLSYNEDNSVKIDALNGQTTDVVINTIVPQGWCVLSLPFDLPDGFKPTLGLSAKQFVGSSYIKGSDAANPPTVKLFFEDVTALKANTPYLVLAHLEQNLFNYPFENVTVSNVADEVTSKYANFIPTNSQTIVTGDPADVRCISGSYTVIEQYPYVEFEHPYAYTPGPNPVINGLSGYLLLTNGVPQDVSCRIVFGPYEPEDEGDPYDLSGDGNADANDVAALVAYLMGKAPEGFLSAKADVNGDGIVNIADIIALVNILLSK